MVAGRLVRCWDCLMQVVQEPRARSIWIWSQNSSGSLQALLRHAVSLSFLLFLSVFPSLFLCFRLIFLFFFAAWSCISCNFVRFVCIVSVSEERGDLSAGKEWNHLAPHDSLPFNHHVLFFKPAKWIPSPLFVSNLKYLLLALSVGGGQGCSGRRAAGAQSAAVCLHQSGSAQPGGAPACSRAA